MSKIEFQKATDATLEILKDYSPIILRDEENDAEVGDTVLYLLDDAAVSQLLTIKNKIESLFTPDSEDSKKYSFTKIVKAFNLGEPVTDYSTRFESKWKQVNEPKKVIERLDTEFDIWVNTYKKYSEKTMKKEGMTNSQILSQEGEIRKKIEAARERLEYVKENFDDLDVRISSRKRANNYGTIMFKIDGKQKHRHLSNKIPNILHYHEKTIDSRDKLTEYLKVAINVCGDIYYAEKKYI